MDDALLLDEDALMAVVDDVWAQQSPLASPLWKEQQKPKKKRRRDRNRPWHEIARLQSEAVELERELQDQLTKSSKKARKNLEGRSTNAKLEKMLLENAEDICTLEQNVTQQLDTLVQALPDVLVGASRTLPFDMDQDYSMYRAMVTNVDKQYSDMDRVLELAGLNNVKAELLDAYVTRSKSADTMQWRALVFTPFKCHIMVKTLWRFFESYQAEGLEHIDLHLLLGKASRIAVIKHEIMLGDYMCSIRMLVKQFVEKERTVHVWNVVTDWTGVGTARNVRTFERGWGFNQSTGNGDSSSCLNYSLVNPTIDGIPCSENSETLIKVYQRFMLWRVQSLENQTLDETILDEKKTATHLMKQPRLNNAPPSPPCSSTSTPSSSPPLHSMQRLVSSPPSETSPTSERGQEPSHSPVSKKVTRKRTPKSRRHRNRPIHEITRLKQQIPVLETEVRVLWVRAGELQRQSLRVTAENVELKNRLHRSVTHAKLLETKLQHYLKQKSTVEASMLPDRGAAGRNLPFDAVDTQILQMLSKNVDENYRKMNQVYEVTGMNEVQKEMEEAKVLTTEDDSSLLQIRSMGLLPFRQEVVLKAMWTSLENQTVLKDHECMEIGLELGKASRVIVLKREIVLRGRDDTSCVSCTIRVVLKQFLERGREIHVWDAFGDWPRAVSTREYGWGVITPMNMKEAGGITVVKNVIFMTSTKISADEEAATEVAAQHSVARLYKQIMQDRQRVVENALLDKSCASSGVTC